MIALQQIAMRLLCHSVQRVPCYDGRGVLTFSRRFFRSAKNFQRVSEAAACVRLNAGRRPPSEHLLECLSSFRVSLFLEVPHAGALWL